MKRIFSLVAAVAASLVLAVSAQAQFGFLVGLTSSSIKMSQDDAISLYHAGLTYQVDLPYHFSLQPALLYQVKGANVGHLDTATDEDFKVKTGFVELPLAIQWGPKLAAFRPYVFAEPFVGYRVSSPDKGDEASQDWAKRAKNQFEYGFGLGAGLEIADHIQLSAQWFNNLGAMFNASADAGAEPLENVRNFEGIKFTLAILF